MPSAFPRCTGCGKLPTNPVDGGSRLVCGCGAVSVEFRQPVDVLEVRRLTVEALDRARLVVHPVPLHGTRNRFTLGVERGAEEDGLSRDEARRYADAVNGEAELARATIRLLAELEQLRMIVATQRRTGSGSGTMPRVEIVTDEFSDDEANTG